MPPESILDEALGPVPFAGPSITDRELEYVADAAANGFYTRATEYVRRLESTVAKLVGVEHVLATPCATHALHLGAVALGLGPGDEVIVQDMSWIATAHPIAYTGATCVFVDICPETWGIDPQRIEDAITPRTRAIALAHTYGIAADVEAVRAIADRHGLAVVEDAAPALGTTVGGRFVGGFGDVAAFSFHGAKIAVAGEGGVFLCRDSAVYERARVASVLGRTDSEAVFWSDSVGYKYVLSNLCAAMACAQVERIEELVARKREIRNWYADALQDCVSDGLLDFVDERPGTRSNYAYPSCLLADDLTVDRDELLAWLARDQIHCRPAFPAMSAMPMYAPHARFDNPVTRSVARRGLSLPSAATLTRDQVEFVAQRLRAWLQRSASRAAV